MKRWSTLRERERERLHIFIFPSPCCLLNGWFVMTAENSYLRARRRLPAFPFFYPIPPANSVGADCIDPYVCVLQHTHSPLVYI